MHLNLLLHKMYLFNNLKLHEEEKEILNQQRIHIIINSSNINSSTDNSSTNNTSNNTNQNHFWSIRIFGLIINT